MSTVRSSTVRLCCIAVLAALILLMTFTGIGYIPLGPLKLTLLALPVAIGGAVLGPTAGLLLGTIFGLSSFFTCFGMDAFGSVLLGINPVATAVMWLLPVLPGVQMGFTIIAAVICMRLHVSREAREKARVKWLWTP